MEQESQLTRLGLFDARVPRYTSYPTAPHFSAEVGPAKFEEWIEAIPAGASISLYMHVPFCRRLCWFCACRTQGTQSEEPVRAYSETLLAELKMLKDRLAPGVKLSRLHWGGGTPTLMPADMMRRVANAVFEAVPMGEGAEFSVEIDPNEIDAARMDALAESGMNRASIGVQDFDPQIQSVIGRDQSYEITRAAVEMIRERDVASLNADILYGLPHQTPTKIADSVQKLLSLNPDRVALYGYAHVPWMARRQTMIPSDHLPTPQERLKLFEVARELFVADGYDEIGIDHFALPTDGLSIAQKAGKLRRNFQGYTDDLAEALVGMGASSISRFPQGYAQNASATSAHTAAIREGRFSTARGHEFTAEDKLRARLIEALMCDFEVSTEELVRDFAADREELAAMFKACADHFGDMVQLSDGGLRIPMKGRPLTRMIARHFDAYDLSKAGHSSAI
ncbi:oxygen-independent coproporphyrinogen III oxidase [Thioclava sp. L04-15]|uniref:oxygen-independent coproporphyrinogen III oxidase n=1 Tax=Thioclava sp. L04-15 TaxID=1915318 RepID=UPI000996416F|nr:oxygen-independent coproporphyrinogen III oxidase [Thioclava sp. L04-15]OOY28854.1 oxygen-independent coproporphyrinogen III oxidase [Thioclava sp. L04-15]TNE83379.1 MAG: oxygen-independent coproporphyrinogen III oxidase [Paracoccaceae bacterium]